MTAPTIRLATDEDMRSINSRNVDEILDLPHLYIATDDPDVMRAWGVARPATIQDFERLYPGGLVAPRFSGESASRGDLLYNGAEAAAAYLPRS